MACPVRLAITGTPSIESLDTSIWCTILTAVAHGDFPAEGPSPMQNRQKRAQNFFEDLGPRDCFERHLANGGTFPGWGKYWRGKWWKGFEDANRVALPDARIAPRGKRRRHTA